MSRNKAKRAKPRYDFAGLPPARWPLGTSVGVDPDWKGTVCACGPSLDLLAVFRIDSLGRELGAFRPLHRWLEDARERVTLAAIEVVGARPGEGRSSVFTFGHVYGRLLGVLEASLSCPVIPAAPKVWQATTSPLRDHAKRCGEFWPDAAWPTRTGRVIKRLAAGALIARYAAIRASAHTT